MSLSPAAHGLYADLCLLTRLPLPTFDGIVGADAAAVSLDAVKERVFGATEGPPRTERESVERYILAIVEAFNASGATSIDTFDHDVRRHAALCARMSIVLDEHAAALATLDKAHERIERLQEINERLETRNREATQAGASLGGETRGLLAEKDAEIERLRSDLASTRTAHAEITASHAKLAADLTHKDRLLRDMNAALTHAREEAKTAHAALTAEQGRSDRLRAVMVDLIADLNAAKEGGE